MTEQPHVLASGLDEPSKGEQSAVTAERLDVPQGQGVMARAKELSP